jgi:PAS domain S-box-containing protein
MAQALQKTEASYRGIVEDQVDLICRYRLDGKLTFVNSAYAQAFGRKRNELVGQPFPLVVFFENYHGVFDFFGIDDLNKERCKDVDGVGHSVID